MLVSTPEHFYTAFSLLHSATMDPTLPDVLKAIRTEILLTPVEKRFRWPSDATRDGKTTFVSANNNQPGSEPTGGTKADTDYYVTQVQLGMSNEDVRKAICTKLCCTRTGNSKVLEEAKVYEVITKLTQQKIAVGAETMDVARFVRYNKNDGALEISTHFMHQNIKMSAAASADLRRTILVRFFGFTR